MAKNATSEQSLIKKVWNMATVLAGQGVGFTDYITQLTYLLFLKMDEENVELFEEESAIPDDCTWNSLRELDGMDLLEHYEEILRRLSREEGLIGTIYTKAVNKIEQPVYLKKVITMIDEEDWLGMDVDVKGAIYEGILEKNGQDKKSGAGQYFTPRPLINAMVDCIRPKIGETVCDPACGTGGFLTSTIAHMGSITTTEQLNTLQTTIFGWEKKPLPYLLAMTNLILHDIETPQIRHINSLNRPVTDYSAKDRVDVIVANPPFGGAEDDAVKQNFPAEFSTSETADLFLVLMMYLLKDKGRCGVVLPDGFMFGDGVKAAIKKRMLDEFGLHTIIRLPQVFKPYASVNTNLLFFQKGVPSRGVWFYRLDYPEGVKSFTKTRPILDKHFDPVREWWADKQPIVVEGKDKARFFTVDELVALNYDFDKCCPFPHEEEEILEPAELIARYQSERAELNANIDRILTEISAMLEVKES